MCSMIGGDQSLPARTAGPTGLEYHLLLARDLDFLNGPNHTVSRLSVVGIMVNGWIGYVHGLGKAIC